MLHEIAREQSKNSSVTYWSGFVDKVRPASSYIHWLHFVATWWSTTPEARV